MSRAARDPLPADRLPRLAALAARISEALPDPAHGPIRSRLADDGAARVDRATGLMDAAIDGYATRLAAVVTARMRGPKARKGTRFWDQSPDGVKTVFSRGETGSLTHKTGIEVKALDPDYVLPDRTVTEVADAVRPVGLRIVADAAGSVARALGRPNTGLAAFDWGNIEAAVDSAIEQILGAADRQAAMVRREILHADATAESLDAAIDMVTQAMTKGGNWLKIYGRTLATALAGDAALGAARSLGVTHAQWVTRDDDRVRASHREADGQQRAIGDHYLVGGFLLKHPGDPDVLPEGLREIANCFVAGTEVSAPDVEGSFRALYVGDIVTIRTVTGRVLTGTPNHPILTERGWVALGELHEGDHVIGARAGQQVSAGVDPDVKGSPTLIEQVHHSMLAGLPARRVSRAAVNFHGDRPAGEVDVVAADCSLRLDFYPPLLEHSREDILPGRDGASQVSAGGRAAGPLFIADNSTAYSVVSGGRERGSLQGGQPLHAERHGFTAPAWLYSGAQQAMSDGGPTDPEVFYQRLLALAGQVGGDQGVVIDSNSVRPDPLSAASHYSRSTQVLVDGVRDDVAVAGGDCGERLTTAVMLDRIVEIERAGFSGHVFDLQTTAGTYLANGIVAHNCRCSLRFEQPTPDKRRAVAAARAGTPSAARALLAAPGTGAMVNADDDSGVPASIPEVVAPDAVVGYRVLESEVPVTPGQRLSWPGMLTLALAPPAVAGVASLAVTVPAGAAVGVAGGSMVLPAGAVLAVLTVSQGQVVAQPVMPPPVPSEG